MVTFRKIERKDLEEIFPLLQQLTEIDYSKRSLESCWNNFISNTSSNSLVGIYNNKVVAYGSIVIENKIRGELAGYIEDIVVDKSVRGKSVGTNLIKELLNIAKEKLCYRVTLTCNDNLIKFYEGCGFSVGQKSMKIYLK
jgi:glucosamine-phosphate N-acetyltransferase